jgi:hypothetical protein
MFQVKDEGLRQEVDSTKAKGRRRPPKDGASMFGKDGATTQAGHWQGETGVGEGGRAEEEEEWWATVPPNMSTVSSGYIVTTL